MELSEFIGVIRKWKWLVIPVVILVTGFTYYTGMRADTTYQAQTIVVVGLSQMTSPGGAGYLVVNAPKIGTTFRELVTTEPVMKKSLENAGLDWNQATLSSMITTELPKDSTIMKIIVTDTDPLRAKHIADTVADAFIQYIKEINEASFESSRKIMLEDMAKNDSELAAATAAGTTDGGSRIRTLQQAQAALQTKYNDLLNERSRSGDIRVVQPASPYRLVGVQAEQRTIIAFVVSLIAAIALAFIAEAISKVYKKPEEGPAA